MKTLLIEKRTNYGTEMMYVIGSDADRISSLTHKKTVDYNDITALEALGFRVIHASDLIDKQIFALLADEH